MNARLTQRMPDELHVKLKEIADRKGLSVNEFINYLASDAIESDEIEALKNENKELRAQIKALTKK